MKLTNLDINSSVFGILKKCFMEFLNKIAPLKNYLNFVTKEVSKAIMMLRTKQKSVFKEEDFRSKNEVQLAKEYMCQSCEKC